MDNYTNTNEDNMTSSLGNDSLLNDTLHQRLTLYPKELILAYNIFLSVTIAFGVPGNLLVLVVFVKMKVSTSTDWFIFFITIFDFLSSVANVPVYLTFTNGSWLYYGNDVICRMHMYFSQVVVITSALVNCGLAVERYLKVCKPHRFQISRNGARNICCLVCLLAALASIPSANIFTNRNGKCTSNALGIEGFLYFIIVFMFFIITIVVITFCYIQICRAIFKSESNVNAHRSRFTKRCIPSSKSRDYGLFHSSRVHPYTDTSSLSVNGQTENTKTNNEVPPQSKLRGKCFELNDLGRNSSSISAKTNGMKTSMWTTENSESLKQFTNNCLNTLGETSTEPNSSSSSMTQKPTAKSYNLTFQVSRQSARTTKISLLVCTIFIVSWVVPLSCFILLQFVKTIPVIRFSLFGRMTYLLSTFTNPFVYAWLNVKFRLKLKKFFYCFK